VRGKYITLAPKTETCAIATQSLGHAAHPVLFDDQLVVTDDPKAALVWGWVKTFLKQYQCCGKPEAEPQVFHGS
jgi:hypothetical protein